MSNKVSKYVTDQELNAIMWIESSGNPNARAGTSTATGLFQFLKGTWRDTVKKHRPDVFKRFTNGALLSMRTHPSFAIEMGARFTEDNRKTIGTNSSLGDLYLAHFLGSGDARKLFKADPATPVSTLVSPNVIAANRSIMAGKTAGQVRAWAAGRMKSATAKAADYVSKYYTGPYVIPVTAISDEVDVDPALPVHVEEDQAQARPGLVERGDARLYDNQAQLKSMNYNPGGLDGVWGGGVSGAMSAFFTDRGLSNSPNEWHEYDRNYESIDAEIDKAEAEKFRRPVTKAREEADPEVVERVAPEIVPAKRSLWTTIGGFFTALGTTVYKGVEWLMGYQDQAERWGIMYYIDRVPTFVWMLLGTVAVGAVVFFTLRTVRGIEKPVTTGERM